MAALTAQDAEQDVLGARHLGPQRARLLTGELDRVARLGGHQHPARAGRDALVAGAPGVALVRRLA
jgi:hypothetical protein